MIPNIQRAAGDPGDESVLAERAVSAQVEEVRPGKPVDSLALYRSGHCEQPLLMRDEWIRPEQNSLHPTEHCRVRTDAQSQTQDGQGRKAWAAAQLATAVLQVLKKIVQEPSAARIPALLLDL